MLKKNLGKKPDPTVSLKVCTVGIMFLWCVGLGVRLMSEGSLVQYVLWGDYILLFLSATQFSSVQFRSIFLFFIKRQETEDVFCSNHSKEYAP
jgi:predicted membrane protein